MSRTSRAANENRATAGAYRKRIRSAARLCALPLLLGCQNSGTPFQPDDGAAYFPGATWRTARPEEVGLPAAAIQSFADRARNGTLRELSSLVIVRNGYLVAEHYFGSSSANDVHTMQSVTKSITSLVAGIAIDEGHTSLNTRLFDILPQYAQLATDTHKAQIRLVDLLAMRAGINFYESPYPGSPLERLNTATTDWVPIALEPPMNAAPDAQWQYNSGGVIVVAAAVQEATGTDFVTYAHDRLFARIGITRERWVRSPANGLPHAGGGLSITATDLARIGYLVLRGGKWDGNTIVSEGWLVESMRPRTLRPRTLGGRDTDYGLLWWLFPIDPQRKTTETDNVVYTASGNLTQWLFVVPRYDLVMVVTGHGNSSFNTPAQFLFDELLPNIRD